MLTRWMLYSSLRMLDPRGFLRFILGIGLLTIILGILFRNKGYVQSVTQISYLVIGSGYKDWFER
jgi:hypothetical protein